MRLYNKPVLCNYYVTYRCNASCGFCDIWEKPSPYINLPDVERNLNELYKLGVKIIDFTGGEPLLHREIDVMLQMAKRIGFITTLTTNTLLYPKKAEKLKGLVDMLHFSLDYATKELHDEARGVACFDHVMRSIEIAKELGERPDILFTVFNSNIDEIERVYNDIAIPNNLVLILNPSFTYNKVGEVLTESTLNYLEKWANKKNIFLNKAFLQLRRNGGNSTEFPVCKAGSTTVVISPNNELVLPCYHLGSKKFPINKNLLELWHSTEAQKIIAQEGRLKECEGCTINCYMQPSFSTQINSYFWKSLPSTLKYNYLKGTWKKISQGSFW